MLLQHRLVKASKLFYITHITCCNFVLCYYENIDFFSVITIEQKGIEHLYYHFWCITIFQRKKKLYSLANCSYEPYKHDSTVTTFGCCVLCLVYSFSTVIVHVCLRKSVGKIFEYGVLCILLQHTSICQFMWHRLWQSFGICDGGYFAELIPVMTLAYKLPTTNF